MIFLYLLLCAVLIPIALYFRFLIKKSAAFFGLDVNNPRIRLAIWVTAILVTLPGLNLNGYGTVGIIYFLIFSWILQIPNLLIKNIGRNIKSKVIRAWNFIHAIQIIPLVLTVIILIVGYANIHNVIKTEYTVYTDKPISDGGYRIALVADVHYGISLDYDALVEKCNEISENDPDILVLCGDIVDDHATMKEMQEVFFALSTVKTKYGIYYVYGNHDRQLYSNSPAYTEKELENVITDCGIKILRDEVDYINDDFVIVGREDRGYNRAERAEISDILSQIDPETFVLTLDHQPNEYVENSDAGTDLILSGHTHAGQLWPLNYFMDIIKFNDANYGLYTYGDMSAIVTSGFAGWGFKVKTAAPSEYVIIDILNK